MSISMTENPREPTQVSGLMRTLTLTHPLSHPQSGSQQYSILPFLPTEVPTHPGTVTPEFHKLHLC